MVKIYPNATLAWLDVYEEILLNGKIVSPRGSETLELLNNSFGFDMKYPICYHQNRKLVYAFMAAEADWITRGSNSLADLEPYNRNMAQFSDDGVILSGAYGIPYLEQFDYVVETLHKDHMTRQAVMTIWKPNPPSSKDIPCTVTMSWNIRNNRLNCHVFMRSSDAHLGLPYDMFSFTMMTLKILTAYNKKEFRKKEVIPGNMYMNLASSHIYDYHYEVAQSCVMERPNKSTSPIPKEAYKDWYFVEKSMQICMDKSDVLLDSDLADHIDFWRIRPR